jgi:hypothetical protein
MKTIARHWEDRFDELIKDGLSGHYKQRLEWFLFKLHSAVQTFECQNDGSRLLIFDDGSVYGEESELDALLALARRRKSKTTAFSHAARRQEHCRKKQRYVTPRIQLRG